jgi:hypothetical protein
MKNEEESNVCVCVLVSGNVAETNLYIVCIYT